MAVKRNRNVYLRYCDEIAILYLTSPAYPRGRPVPADPKPPRKLPANPHRWTAIALGRICSACGLVQATGEFDDSSQCPRRPK